MSAFQFTTPRRTRRPSLTPMIDVVFLLLVFFMLAARFGVDTVLTLSPVAASASATWDGPPRLVQFAPDALRLNGTPISPERLPAALLDLMPEADVPVLLQATPGADLQQMIDLMEQLEAAGIRNVLLVE